MAVEPSNEGSHITSDNLVNFPHNPQQQIQ